MDNGASSYRRFLMGEQNAFDEIMEELFDSLVFFINRYVNDFHSAEDIAIDCFADLVANKNRYNFKTSLKTYLFMMGRSRALNHLRRKKIITFVNLSEAENIKDSEEGFEEIILKSEQKRKINNALKTLDEEARVAVHLVYFEDMKYEDAAKILRKTPKQIDNLIYRAKKELRIILRKDGEEPL